MSPQYPLGVWLDYTVGWNGGELSSPVAQPCPALAGAPGHRVMSRCLVYLQTHPGPCLALSVNRQLNYQQRRQLNSAGAAAEEISRESGELHQRCLEAAGWRDTNGACAPESSGYGGAH